VVNLNENLAYSGVFSQTGGAVNVVAGDALTLTGSATLSGVIGGAGTVAVSSATVGPLAVGGTATLADGGTAHQTGLLTLGDAGSGAATLSIGAGASFSIDGDWGIARGKSLASSVVNSGLLIKSTGAGTSVVDVSITDAGAIEVASGTLDFTHAVSGSGGLAIDAGATLELGFSASSSLTATFKGANGTLALGNPAQFAATIAGFDSTDTIQLVGRTATQATVQPGDKLVITDGGMAVATLQLSGNYAGDTFHVASDGSGGTLVTVTTHAAASHRFVAAMAGLGAGGAGSVAGLGHTHPEALPLALAARGAMHSA
jgi:hypothetical protein